MFQEQFATTKRSAAYEKRAQRVRDPDQGVLCWSIGTPLMSDVRRHEA